MGGGKRGSWRAGSSLPQMLNQRAIQGRKVSGRFQRERHVTADLIDRLGLYQELEGHTGCVNCLEWNRSGKLLASGSDDKTVILWNGETGRKMVQLSTEHAGNIFSVKFLPEDRAVVTGAQDGRVCLIDVARETVLQSANFHFGRVKRLAVSPETPGLFWSAAEDGLVMQWDTRERWRPDDPNVLVNLVKHSGRLAEAKCIAVCPLRPELLAVGANDPYVRIFDRRMLSLQRAIDADEGGTRLSNWDRRARLTLTEGAGDETPIGAVSYFVPGHLPGATEKHSTAPVFRMSRPLTSTYLTFSPDGRDLIVNLGSEQIYIYDKFALFEKQTSTFEQLAVIEKICDSSAAVRNGFCGRPPLPERIEKLKLAANGEFESGNYSAAIRLYNCALQCLPRHPTLLSNRAAALMKRSWSGDVFAALRDCLAALDADPAYVKAHLRVVRCLMELDRTAEATRCLALFSVRFPDQMRCQAFLGLERDLKAALEKEGAEAHGEASSSESSSGSNSNSSSAAATSRSPGLGVDFRRGALGQSGEGGVEDVISPSPTPERGRRISAQEQIWRREARDYTARYVGTCNTTTDIKEANFFGNNGQFVVAGSDDGKFFIWDRETTNILKVLIGDESIVNCLQGHPLAPILATSGIEPVVRIWQPMPEDGSENPRQVQEYESVVKTNQRRMDVDPLEMFIRLNDIELPFEERGGQAIQCSQS